MSIISLMTKLKAFAFLIFSSFLCSAAGAELQCYSIARVAYLEFVQNEILSHFLSEVTSGSTNLRVGNQQMKALQPLINPVCPNFQLSNYEIQEALAKTYMSLFQKSNEDLLRWSKESTVLLEGVSQLTNLPANSILDVVILENRDLDINSRLRSLEQMPPQLARIALSVTNQNFILDVDTPALISEYSRLLDRSLKSLEDYNDYLKGPAAKLFLEKASLKIKDNFYKNMQTAIVGVSRKVDSPQTTCVASQLFTSLSQLGQEGTNGDMTQSLKQLSLLVKQSSVADSTQCRWQDGTASTIGDFRAEKGFLKNSSSIENRGRKSYSNQIQRTSSLCSQIEFEKNLKEMVDDIETNSDYFGSRLDSKSCLATLAAVFVRSEKKPNTLKFSISFSSKNPTFIVTLNNEIPFSTSSMKPNNLEHLRLFIYNSIRETGMKAPLF